MRRKVVILISLVVSLLLHLQQVESTGSGKVQVLHGSPYVNLQHGIYFGKTLSSQKTGRMYHAFLGIRYAATPKRYEKSVPMSDLGMMSLPFIAQSAGSPCPQLSPDGSSFQGREDCLFGDLFVPARDPVDKDGFPVIVFIHPGAFKSGSGGAFNVSYFMEEESVICATFNFRMSTLGFLSSNDEVLPGNLGLHDQITFLEWIRDNIEDFGGNKRRITVAGVESGAASVSFLLLSQRSKGLFQSAIIHGGSMLPSSFVPHFVAYPHSKQFSDGLECPYKPSQLLTECLKIKRLKDLMRSQKSVSENYFNFTSPFFPSFEKCSQYPICSDSFFSRSPAVLLSDRQYKRVPLLIGMNSIEAVQDHQCMRTRNSRVPVLRLPRSQLGGGGNNSSSSSTLSEAFQSWLLQVLVKIPGLNREDLLSSSNLFMEIQQLYFNVKDGGSENNEELMVPDKSFEIFLYDVLLRYGVRKFAVTYASDKPVYPYIITLGGSCNGTIYHDHHHNSEVTTSMKTRKSNTISGPFPDGTEFLTPSLPDYHLFKDGSREEIFSQNFVRLWVTFATHLKPVEVWTNKETWLPLSASQLNGEKPLTWYSLHDEVDIVYEEGLFQKRMKFWDRLFKQKISAYRL